MALDADLIGKIIGGGALIAGTYLFDEWKAGRKKKKEMQERPKKLDADSKIREQVGDLIYKMQVYTGADRVMLFMYSNGTYTHSGVSLEYINCTYEAVADNVAPSIDEFQKVPLSKYQKIINRIIDDPHRMTKITTQDDDVEIVKLQKLHGVSGSLNVKITKSVWDGIVSFSFLSRLPELPPEHIDRVDIDVTKICNLMAKLSVK